MMRSRIVILAMLVLMLSLAGFGCAKKAGGPGDGSGTSWEDQERARLEQERALREKMGQAANELAQMVHFAFDSSNLTAESRQILTRKAEIMRQYPQIKLIIEGNCDQRGTAEYNLALGERRAQASAQYLSNLGIAADRLSTVSYGKERPLDPGHSEAAYAKNRRDEFRATY
ncbi:peptidoglycan-associated lipoprotein Pal [Solidesulfovibrio sp.]|uniref:peptidoglycan-associated lipoprotein Pal n=1 Tax=Solidesulfovibrio sp. TaxID=2910990 RepID=UPI000EC0E0AA|nr:peptidoglycan-associated lipoprotein Pal [Solidesulfovibrio sp.]MEA5088997.1 peptidoglycan-associated lipoprotein Pal [Solidesulfovibrio sp.]HCR12465.1 peptidoglycan-associated lipoprotein Pal [Desulfovibrio sp.]HML61073.1 peptidoglycan-associated lipoprotein Pal [Solidesulfovibrio sp.]